MTGRHNLAAKTIDALLEASVVGSFSRIGFALRARMFGYGQPTVNAVADRHVLLTGANSGIGLATVIALLAQGATVTATTRSPEKSRALRAHMGQLLGDEAAGRLFTDELDLHDLASVRRFAARHADRPIDTLVHNAGALTHTFEETVDGFEHTVQTHVLAPFLLTTLLLDTLQRSGNARVITVTSGGLYTARLNDNLFARPRDGFNGTAMYAEAKRAQLVLTSQWQRRFGGPGLSFYATHPGWVQTPGLEAALPGFVNRLKRLLRTPQMGADTILYLIAHTPPPLLHRVWHDRQPRRQHRLPTTFNRRGRAGQLWADACAAVETTPYARSSSAR
jgi:NAD(P)-dependent dehydrogenase (short-subunit alcohol dehydrogenase family)